MLNALPNTLADGGRVWRMLSLLGLVFFSGLIAQAQPASASWNYTTATGALGTKYSWIDCSGGSNIVSGDDAQAFIAWPFDFDFYDNSYTTSNVLSVCSNGYVRLDGTANTSFQSASSYSLTAEIGRASCRERV